MSNNVKFEGYERRIEKIKKCMAEYGIKDLEDARCGIVQSLVRNP